KTLGRVGVVADVAKTVGGCRSEMFDYWKVANKDDIDVVNVNKGKKNNVMVSLVKNNKMYEINDGKPEYLSDLSNERIQESRFVDDFDNKVSEDEMMVVIEALLGVVMKINIMMRGLVCSLMNTDYDSNKINKEKKNSNKRKVDKIDGRE
ncbi:4024_t:CDS:1, partial [Racocetra fulgida]